MFKMVHCVAAAAIVATIFAQVDSRRAPEHSDQGILAILDDYIANKDDEVRKQIEVVIGLEANVSVQQSLEAVTQWVVEFCLVQTAVA